MNWQKILGEMVAAALGSQVQKFSTWITHHVGNPSSPAAVMAVQVGVAGLTLGAAALAAHPDHPELRAAGESILGTLQSALTAGAPTPTPTPEPAQ